MKNNSKNKITLPYLDDFLLYLQSNNYSDETLYNYERDLMVFENFLDESSIPFDKVNKRTIESYKAYLSSIDRKTPIKVSVEKKLGSYSTNRFLSSLRSYFRYLIKMDYPSPIPPDAITLIKKEKKVPKVPEFQDTVKLIESPSQLEKNQLVAKRNRAVLEVFFSTGMRISELVNLKLNQINKEGQIYILGKGKKERFVYLTPRASRYLKEYLKTRNDGSPYVFIPYSGRNKALKDKKISTNYIQYKLKQYREMLGINVPISPHAIRRAFATYLAESGASPAAIQILLGHESLDTTTRYVQISNRYAKKVHEKFHPLKE
ncbi:MAG: tyrosine-type recombinase/integrase [Patescibacteria group bacterium]